MNFFISASWLMLISTDVTLGITNYTGPFDFIWWWLGLNMGMCLYGFVSWINKNESKDTN